TSVSGQPAPRMCSLRFSPVPTPRKKRPSIIAAAVAAAWATMAGCMRMVGQVTHVPSSSRSVACAMPPITAHTNGLWPCVSVQGWKWSEMFAKENPCFSAICAYFTRSFGRCSSLDNCYTTQNAPRDLFLPGSLLLGIMNVGAFPEPSTPPFDAGDDHDDLLELPVTFQPAITERTSREVAAAPLQGE